MIGCRGLQIEHRGETSYHTITWAFSGRWVGLGGTFRFISFTSVGDLVILPYTYLIHNHT